MALVETTSHDSATRPASGGGLIRRLLLILILIAAVVFVVWKIRQNKASQAVEADKTAAAAARPVAVQVAPVAKKPMPIYLTALGSVTPYYSVTIKTRVDGQLMSVNVREGQAVHKGQLLAEIDRRPYEAALAQAQGQLAKDEAAAKYNTDEASRYNSLYEAGVVSKESAQTQTSNAGQSTGTLVADRAAIEAAKVNLIYTRITSAIDGVVGLRQVDPGNIVHAADTNGLILVNQLQPITVVFTLPEDQLPQVLQLMHSGHELAVEAYDRSESTHLASGKLLTIDNTIDTTTGTVKGKAVFANQDDALFPNQFVNVRLVLQERPDAIVIPAAAIQTGTEGTFVFLVKPGPGKQDSNHSAPAAKADPEGGKVQSHVEVQPVVIDVTEGSQVILNSGLKAGDSIVVDGQEKLKDQSNVTTRQATGGKNGPSTQPIAPDASKGGKGKHGAAPDSLDAPQSGGQPAGKQGHPHGQGAS